MDLFDPTPDHRRNLLPMDGRVEYHGRIMAPDAAQGYFHTLMETIAWEHDQAVVFGKTFVTPRKVAWYADRALEYTYSKVTKTALPWTPALMELKAMVERVSGESFNACLLNLYHNGSEGMAWHSDGERDLKPNGAIASLSFGAERKFAFKHKRTGEVVHLVLEHGSLLMMLDETQRHWLHRLPPTKVVSQPRVNLTFRMMLG